MDWREARRREIHAIVQARGINAVFHATQIENLPSIMEYGIHPRSTLDEHQAPYLFSDGWRNDGELGATSISIGSWARHMIASKRKTMPAARWVVLAIDPSILWTHHCRFCPTNAASNEVLHANARLMERSDALEAMFADNAPYGTQFDGSSWRDHLKLRPDQPTRYDAEVLIFGSIDSDLIVGACVENAWHIPFVKKAVARHGGAGFEIDTVKSFL